MIMATHLRCFGYRREHIAGQEFVMNRDNAREFIFAPSLFPMGGRANGGSSRRQVRAYVVEGGRKMLRSDSCARQTSNPKIR